ncbi:MAG TPA: DsbE family thiol:disulfide interchange protein [Nevskiales bacterium]|nr:DsbE family thiol:disulfide interchange protein [Nevskiales bacterium]
MRWRYLLPLLIVALLFALLAVGLTLDPRRVPSPLIGKPAPAFTLPRLSDPQQTVSAIDWHGEVCLVNVWASWCASCRDEHPLLLELARQAEVPIYGLNYKDQWDEALAWLARFGNPYRDSVFDAEGRAGLDWGVYGVPETFVLDKQGRIRHKHIGAITHQDLEQTLLPLVRQLQQEPG